MAKLIKVGIGMILSVEKINPEKDYDEWAWRKKYEKFLSVIELYESERCEPESHFALLYDKAQNWIKTGIGTLSFADEDTLVLTTKNSRYTVRILKTIF